MAVALSTYALISGTEAEYYIDGGTIVDSTKQDLLYTAINQCSGLIENYLGRLLVTRGTITEYHNIEESESELFLGHWPIIAVSDVYEDTGRIYAATSKLTANTHYLVVSNVGKLIRTYSATDGLTIWQTGFEAIKVIYTAGYASTATIPGQIKDVCMRHVAEVYKEITRKEANYESVSGDMGAFRRIGPAMLTSGMKRDLDPYRERNLGWKTWTRYSVA